MAIESKPKNIPDCELEFVKVDGKVKVKASCRDMTDAIDLKELLEEEPVTIEVKPKAKITK
jgi:hypothetical protein